jgi:L-lactate permease
VPVHLTPSWVKRTYPILLIAIVIVTTGTPLRATLARISTVRLEWPWLHGEVMRSAPVVIQPELYPAAFTSALLIVPGFLVAITALVSVPMLGITPVQALGTLGRTVRQLRGAILTTLGVLALAYVMNYSGIALTVGLGFAAAGPWFPAAAVFLGLVGSGVVGTNTASNALFANLVASGAVQAGVDPTLATGSLGSGGNMGKAIAPASLALATGAANTPGS